ncbi:MAG: hypothetical protein AAFY15_04575 [Cyanobacteria bacterium J06648_11]
MNRYQVWSNREWSKLIELAHTLRNGSISQTEAIGLYQEWTEAEGIDRTRNAVYLKIREAGYRINLEGISA